MKLIYKVIIILTFLSFSVESFSQFTLDGVVMTPVVDCYGDATGEILINVSGGTPPYEYSINGGLSYQAGNNFTGLTSGVYSVIARDFFFVSVSTPVFVTQPTELHILTEVPTPVTGCYGDLNGEIAITASGGTGPYSYSITGGAPYFANGGNFVGVGGGVYNISLQDANGCFKDGSAVTVYQPTQLQITTEDANDVYPCFGDANGTIQIITTGGTPTNEYSVNGGATWQVGAYFSLLSPGDYPVVVKDGNNCTVNGSTLVIDEPLELTIVSETPTDVNTCFGDNTGTMTIVSSGGSGSIFYSVDGGTNSQQDDGFFPALYAGSYDIHVQDENSCTTTGGTIIIDEPPQIVVGPGSKTDVLTCFGDATGQILLDASGGVLPLEYLILPGGVYQGSNTFTVTSGSYSSKIKDALGCEVDGPSYLIEQPILFIINNVTKTNVYNCFGDSDGSISIYTNGGGTQPYSYSIDGGVTFPHGNTITGLPAGTYNVAARDANGCVDYYATVVTITQPTQVIINSEVPTNPTCFGVNNGYITVLAIGGTGSFQYSANDGVNWSSENIIPNLTAVGSPYIIKVRDQKMCEVTGGTHNLIDPPELVIDNVLPANISDCYGGTDGSITITASGGTPPITYSINGGISYQASNVFLGLSAGIYTVRIKDSNNCVTFGNPVNITQPTLLTIPNQSFVNVLGCNGADIGEIHFNASGGTPHIPNGYQYSINGGTDYFYNFGDFTGLSAGTYSLKVKDENDCTATGTDIIITEPPVLVPTLSFKQDIRCFGETNGIISLAATGGSAPIRYSINNGVDYSIGSYFPNLPAGNYQTMVKDQYNCTVAGPLVVISQPTELSVDAVVDTDITDCYGDNDGRIEITVSGGVPAYRYSINNGVSYAPEGQNVFTNLAPGNYYIKVFDQNSCYASYVDINNDIDTIVITQPPRLQITGILKDDIACFGELNGSITITASGGTGAISYSIDNGTSYQASNIFSGLGQGNYIVRTRDFNGCLSNSNPVSIYEPELLIITNVIVTDEKCPGENNGSITIFEDGGTGPYEFSSDGGATYQPYDRNIINLPPGTYTPAVRDARLCTVSDVDVTINAALPAGLFTTDVSSGCSPLDVQFTRLSAGTTYRWEFGDGLVSGTNEPSHTFTNTTMLPVVYTVTAYSVSPSGCLDTTTTDITVNPLPLLSFTATPTTAYYPASTITITNTSPAGYTNYLWDFGDTNTSTLEHPGSHTYADCGDYTITMSADNFWCSNATTRSVLVTAYQPIAEFDVDTTQSCVPVTLNFVNQSTNYETIEWTLSDGTTSSADNFSYAYDIPGSYTVSLNAYGYCGFFDSKDTIITVHQSPIVDFEFAPDTVMLPGQPVNFFNLSSDDSEYFFWEFGDGGTSELENPSWLYTEAGSYRIQLTVTSTNNCVDSMILFNEVIVLPAGQILFPNAFTPNGNGRNDVFKPAVYSSVKSFQMEIYNRWGEKMFITHDIENGWTGYFNGQLCLQDVYVWRAEGMYLNGTPFEMSGSVTLVK